MLAFGSESIHRNGAPLFANHRPGLNRLARGRSRRSLHPDLFREFRDAVFVAHSAQDATLVLALASRVRALYCRLADASPTSRLALAARSNLSTLNLFEFPEVAAVAGIVCPIDEASGSLVAVSVARGESLTREPAGDLTVTMGAWGSVVAKSGAVAVGHLCLRLTLAQREQVSVLRARPEPECGAGRVILCLPSGP